MVKSILISNDDNAKWLKIQISTSRITFATSGSYILMAHSSSESLAYTMSSADVPQLQCTMPFYVPRKVYVLTYLYLALIC